MKKTIALVGNQNCGKTTLFNALTGHYQHVGNFPGVTIEKKSGYIKNHKEYEIIDLPGIYSLTPYTSEEIVSTQFLLNEPPNIIMNIIDATHLQRHLYLTLQLLELNRPMIVIFNMMDEVEKQGHHIQIEELKKALGVPIVSISAKKEKGVQEVIEALAFAKIPTLHYQRNIQESLSLIEKIICFNVTKKSLPLTYCATRIIEQDDDIIKRLSLTEKQKNQIEYICYCLEKQTHQERNMLLIQARYQKIDELCMAYMTYQEDRHDLSDKIDSVVTHPYIGIPLFLFIMFFIFYCTFYLLGQPLQEMTSSLVTMLSSSILSFLHVLHVSNWLQAFIGEGILSGVGSVLSFLPTIIILFFFISLLEDSGYSARIVFIMDALLRKIGLCGQAIIPMLMGFGCSVPSLMATRTMSNEKQKKLTMLLIPFMSCSAKFPIYGMIVATFFRQKASLVFLSIYGLGVFVALLIAFLFQIIYGKEEIPFILELPPYRFPTFQNIYLAMREKAKDFISKVFTTIIFVSMGIWFLQNFDVHFHMTFHQQESLLAYFGTFLTPLFHPLGFDDWRIVTALLTGMSAKESIVSTLSILTSSSTPAQLHSALFTLFTPASAYSFLVFTLLYTPCMATFATLKKELHSLRLALLFVFFQTCIAYFASFFIYHLICLFV